MTIRKRITREPYRLTNAERIVRRLERAGVEFLNGRPDHIMPQSHGDAIWTYLGMYDYTSRTFERTMRWNIKISRKTYTGIGIILFDGIEDLLNGRIALDFSDHGEYTRALGVQCFANVIKENQHRLVYIEPKS